MLEVFLGRSGRRPLRALCIGAHCDDIEIGCGATLLALQDAGYLGAVDWVSLSGSAQRRAETEGAMAQLVTPEIRGQALFGSHSDGLFPGEYSAVKRFIEGLKSLPTPDVIFTHERHDRHQDHRTCNELVWSTFRDHLILEFEIPKWDGELGQPSFFVPVTRQAADRKIEALLTSHVSQRNRDWFTRETFDALLRLRGIESRSPTGLAEGFHVRKIRMAI